MKKALLIGCGGKRGEDLIKGCQIKCNGQIIE